MFSRVASVAALSNISEAPKVVPMFTHAVPFVGPPNLTISEAL